MNKKDYISGTEDAYERKVPAVDLIRVQVSYKSQSDKSYAALVDLIFDEKGRNTSGSRLEWFPKSVCTLEKIEPEDPSKEHPSYFITAPKWLLDKLKVKYDPKD